MTLIRGRSEEDHLLEHEQRNIARGQTYVVGRLGGINERQTSMAEKKNKLKVRQQVSGLEGKERDGGTD